MGLDGGEKRSGLVRGMLSFSFSFPFPLCPSNPPRVEDANTSPGQLFGGSAFAKEFIFHLQDYNKATWFQNFVASIAGASASLVVSAPLDVIKTRIQNRNFENPESGFRILTNMARHEGPSAFFKGLVPKVPSHPRFFY
jgi:hypothetical protein